MLEKSNFRETAIASIGVSPYIVRDWIRKGERDRRNGVESIERDLAVGMDQAEAKAEADLIGGIREAGFLPFVKSDSDKGQVIERGDWRALSWIAERRGSKNWGIKKNLEVTIGRDREKLLEMAEKVLDGEQFDKLIAAFIAAEESDSTRVGEGETSEETSDE